MQPGKLQIPRLAIDPFAFVHDLQTRLFLQYIEIVDKTKDGKRLAETIGNDPRVQDLEGKMISHGYGAELFDKRKLTMWFAWCVNEYGLERSEEFLDRFLNESKISVLNVLWVLGVEVTEPIQLVDGYEILPIDRLPDTREKELFLRDRFGHNILHARPSPTTAIIYPCKVQKVVEGNSLSSHEGDEDLFASGRQIYDIALLLNAVDGISCLPYFSTSYVDPSTPFGLFGGSGGSAPIYDVLGHNTTKLTEDAQTVINRLIRRYGKLSEHQKRRFQTILNRLSQAKRRSQIEDKILDLGMTLEMLLLEDNKNNDQLSLSFRLRGSWLLGKTEKDRVEIYRQLKDIYMYRSQVAHSGILCNGNNDRIQKVREAFPAYLSLAEQVCRWMLENDKPNWDEIVLNVKLNKSKAS